MELFYNPERMTETEIRETFVAHQWLVDEILSIVKQQPQGAGMQHAVIIAPRGMGKTTVLLMLRFNILASELADAWQPVLFPEESYQVYDLADFWVAVLNHLSDETSDEKLSKVVSQFQSTYRGSRELEEAALATLKDWRNKNNKQLIALIDSFDLILSQIGDDADHAKLRDVLMNDGTMMLIGCATTFFKEARAYDQPLYNLFKIYNLQNLTSEHINELLRRRAKLDGVEDFDEQLRKNAARLRVLEYFTGGNPRLVMMLYRVITRSEVSEVRRGLEKLLDEVTPYYKAKIENLPPQQRKILDHIARISARTREGLTPSEIAVSTRLPVNQVSSQLKRLADIGYVRAANIRGRSSYYTLSEPLYAIWHQMRFGREARERMNWLVTFLKGWYDVKEINTECAKLQDRFQEYMTEGRLSEARDVLEYRRYLLGALENDSDRARTSESIILSYLELKDIDTLRRELLSDINTAHLTHDTQLRLVAEGLLSQDQMKPDVTHQTERESRKAQSDMKVEEAQAALNNGDFELALQNFRLALELAPNATAVGGILLIQLLNDDLIGAARTIEDAETLFARDSPQRTGLRAFKCAVEGDLPGATAHLNKLENKLAVSGWNVVGLLLQIKSHLNEAFVAFSRLNELDPENFSGWFHQGEILMALNRYEEALETVARALSIDPGSAKAHKLRAEALQQLSKHSDALLSFDRAVELDPNTSETWSLRAASLVALDRKEEALTSFENAYKLDPEDYRAPLLKAWLLWTMGRNSEVLKALDVVLKIKPDSFDAHYLRGLSLAATGKNAAAVKALEQAFNNSVDGGIMWDSRAACVKFILSVSDGDLVTADQDWRHVRTFLENDPSEEAVWLETASNALRSAAELGHWEFVRKLIATSDLDEKLFPLARALDYLITGDDTLIEKLSPEIKRIVEEIVIKLKKSAPKRSARNKKARKRGRRKT